MRSSGYHAWQTFLFGTFMHVDVLSFSGSADYFAGQRPTTRSLAAGLRMLQQSFLHCILGDSVDTQ